MKEKRSKLQWLTCLLVAALMMTAVMPSTVSVRAEEEVAGETPSSNVDLIDEGLGGQNGNKNTLNAVGGTSASQMQKQVISGQAPKEVIQSR